MEHKKYHSGKTIVLWVIGVTVLVIVGVVSSFFLLDGMRNSNASSERQDIEYKYEKNQNIVRKLLVNDGLPLDAEVYITREENTLFINIKVPEEVEFLRINDQDQAIPSNRQIKITLKSTQDPLGATAIRDLSLVMETAGERYAKRLYLDLQFPLNPPRITPLELDFMGVKEAFSENSTRLKLDARSVHKATIKLNGEIVGEFPISLHETTFDFTLSGLRPGINVVEFIGEDLAAERKGHSYSVFYYQVGGNEKYRQIQIDRVTDTEIYSIDEEQDAMYKTTVIYGELGDWATKTPLKGSLSNIVGCYGECEFLRYPKGDVIVGVSYFSLTPELERIIEADINKMKVINLPEDLQQYYGN